MSLYLLVYGLVYALFEIYRHMICIVLKYRQGLNCLKFTDTVSIVWHLPTWCVALSSWVWIVLCIVWNLQTRFALFDTYRHGMLLYLHGYGAKEHFIVHTLSKRKIIHVNTCRNTVTWIALIWLTGHMTYMTLIDRSHDLDAIDWQVTWPGCHWLTGHMTYMIQEVLFKVGCIYNNNNE